MKIEGNFNNFLSSPLTLQVKETEDQRGGGNLFFKVTELGWSSGFQPACQQHLILNGIRTYNYNMHETSKKAAV